MAGARAALRRALVVLAPLAVVGPVAAGLIATTTVAAGLLPALNRSAPSFEAWSALLEWPGLAASVALTLRIAVVSTAASLATALLLTPWLERHRRAAAPLLLSLLATPHAALAVGVSALIASSGLFTRLLAPLAGWQVPPDVVTARDPLGLAVMLALVLKEAAFLLLVARAALPRLDVAGTLRVAGSLGHGPARAWALTVHPQLWVSLKLPVMAVLAFSLGSADVPLVLGPLTPPPLAVEVARWSVDPDLARLLPAAAASMVLVAMSVIGVLAIHVAGRAAGTAIRTFAAAGPAPGGNGRMMALAVAGPLSAIAAGALATLPLWAGAASWRFPDLVPTGWTSTLLRTRLSGLFDPAVATVGVGLAATALALLLAVVRLATGAGASRLALFVLLLPQPAMLFGAQVLLVRLGIDGTMGAVLMLHLVYVLPYVLLALAGPWRAVDARYARAAAALGAGPLRTLLRVTLPLRATPLLAAAAIGFSVSCGLYLPTVFAGGGRIETLATRTVALGLGADRRLAAAAGLAAAALPLLAFASAWRRR